MYLYYYFYNNNNNKKAGDPLQPPKLEVRSTLANILASSQTCCESYHLQLCRPVQMAQKLLHGQLVISSLN